MSSKPCKICGNSQAFLGFCSDCIVKGSNFTGGSKVASHSLSTLPPGIMPSYTPEQIEKYKKLLNAIHKPESSVIPSNCQHPFDQVKHDMTLRVAECGICNKSFDLPDPTTAVPFLDIPMYLSGPMTGVSEFNFPAFSKAAAWLRGQGYMVVSPHEVVHNDNGVPGSIPHHQYLKGDIRAMMTCDGIVFLPGWQNSKGAKFEYSIALDLKYKLFHLESHPIHADEYVLIEGDGEYT